MGATATPAVSGLELTVLGHLTRQGRLHLPADPAGHTLLRQPSRWRVQLLEWDGQPLHRHRAEIRANAQLKTEARVPQRWPVDRLIVNTGQQLHTRLAQCDHMRAPLDKSPVVSAVSRPSDRGAESPKETLGLRCLTCQRMVNRFDSSSHIHVNADSSIDLQFTLPIPEDRAVGRLYDTTSPTRQQLSSASVVSLMQHGRRVIPLDPFRFNGPCTVRLVQRFPALCELNEMPAEVGKLLRRDQRSRDNGWVCPNDSCDAAVVNATDVCTSCGTHRSWIERATTPQQASQFRSKQRKS